MRRRLSFCAIFAIAISIALGPGAAARTSGGNQDQAVGAGIEAYFASMGIDPGSVVIQRGTRNYAGPSCPGEGWNCTSASAVVQIASGGARGESVAENEFECVSPSIGTVPPDTCVIVQLAPVTPGATNRAICREASPGVMQSCSISQTNVSGANEAVIEQTIDQQAGSTQSGSQTATLRQSNASGANRATIRQKVAQQTEAESASPITQSQQANQTVDACQGGGADPCAMRSLTGANFIEVKQSLKQQAEAQGPGTISQRQQFPSGGTRATISQRSTSGENESHLRQLNRLDAQAQGAGPSITERQGNSGGGLFGHGGLFGQVDQDSTGVSTSVARQNERQTLDAPPGATQTQIGDELCCQTQGTNTEDAAHIRQLSAQFANPGATQIEVVRGQCVSTGNCDVTQQVNQNGIVTNKSCNAPTCNIQIIIGCAGESCGRPSTHVNDSRSAAVARRLHQPAASG